VQSPNSISAQPLTLSDENNMYLGRRGNNKSGPEAVESEQQQRYASILSQNRARRMNKFQNSTLNQPSGSQSNPATPLEGQILRQQD